MTEYPQNQDIVYSIAASPDFAQDDTCFAGRTSGLFRSEDGGVTWHSAYEALNLDPAPATTTVAVSPAFGSDRTVFAGVPGGILRSGDGGRDWYFAVLPTPPPIVSTLAISPAYLGDGTLLAGTVEDGMYRSEDRGYHWSACNFGLMDLGVLSTAVSPDFTEDDTVFVGTECGIFRSSNGGRAWKGVDFPLEYVPVLSLALSPHYSEDGTIWAGTESCGLFYSANGGRSWEHAAKELIAGPVNAIVLPRKLPGQHQVLIITDQEVLLSRDGGRTWSGLKGDFDAGQALTCLAAPQGLDPGAPLLVGLSDGGVERIEVSHIDQ